MSDSQVIWYISPVWCDVCKLLRRKPGRAVRRACNLFTERHSNLCEDCYETFGTTPGIPIKHASESSPIPSGRSDGKYDFKDEEGSTVVYEKTHGRFVTLREALAYARPHADLWGLEIAVEVEGVRV